MGIYKKTGTSQEGIPYTVLEEYTMYDVHSKKKLEQLVARLNGICEQNGSDFRFQVEENTKFPMTLVVDVNDMMPRTEI